MIYKNGKLVLVTAINPTPLGEGKTTMSIGLADGLSKINKKPILALREPSLGPVFGIKGGAAGGGYAQYTFSIFDDHGHDGVFLIQPGIRVDYSNLWGTFVTPRLHLRWTPTEWVNLRASAGKGYRTSFTLDENNYLLSSSRKVYMDSETQREEDWNAGASVMFKPEVFGKELNFTAEYYYTDFQKQAVIDMDRDAHSVYIYQFSKIIRNRLGHCKIRVSYLMGELAVYPAL